MASLTSLPNEILYRIFQYLERDPTVLSISLTCKHFCAVVEPIIFSYISTENLFAINKIFKAVVKKPHVARFVKEFYASTNADYDDVDSADEMFSVYIADMPKFEHYKAKFGARMPLNTHGRRICARWFERLFRGERNWDAVVAWLIRDFGVTLTVLRMNLLGLQKFYHIERVLSRAATLQQMNVRVNRNHLSKLREVHIQKDDSGVEQDTGIEIRFVVPYLAVPSVKTACISGLREDVVSSTALDEQRTFATETLHLRESYLTAESVQRFLPSFNNLRSFNYRYAAPKSRAIERFSASAVVSGLENSKHCLEELILTKSKKSINFDDDDFDEILTWVEEGDLDIFPLEIDALDGFTCLKHLETGLDILIGVEDDEAARWVWESESEAEIDFKASTSASGESTPDLRLIYSPDQRHIFSTIIPSSIERLTLHDVRPSFTDLLSILWEKSFKEARPAFTTVEVSHYGIGILVVERWKSMAESRGLVFREIEGLPDGYED